MEKWQCAHCAATADKPYDGIEAQQMDIVEGDKTRIACKMLCRQVECRCRAVSQP